MIAKRPARASRAVLVAAAAMTCAMLGAGCVRRSDTAVDRSDPTLPRITLAHLRHLRIDATVNGHAVHAVALYAAAPDYRLVGSPARDGFEGIASVDDAARAAIVFLREYERSGDPTERDEALGLLAFVASMEQGDGEFVNFIDTAGHPNRTAPSSRKSLSFWAARSLWALGEAVRVLSPHDSLSLVPLRRVLARTVTRMDREISAGRLLGGSATATSEALLGLLALQRAEPTPSLASLATRTAALLVPLSRGDSMTAPWGARTDRPDAAWRGWGCRATEALATAAIVLRRPEFALAARREADALWARFLLTGTVAAELSAAGTPKWDPQIAYGVGPLVEGYLALAEATGDRRYAVFAGLTFGWFVGANSAGVVMYDSTTGRTFDGIDGAIGTKVNRNAGAESTVEALLALQRVSGDPDAAEHALYRLDGKPSFSLATLPTRRAYVGPSGARVELRFADGVVRMTESRTASAPIVLTYWPAANPTEVRVAERLTARWNAAHADVKVRVQPLPAGRSSEEVLLAAIVAKATPDISSNVSSALLSRLVRAGSVVRLDDRAATSARLRERTNAAMLASLRLPNGGIYAFPWKTNPLMLMYNVDLLRSAGVAPPATQSELLTVLRRLVHDSRGDGRADHWGLWATLKTTWFERFYDFYPLYLANSGGRTLVHDGHVTFDTEAAVAAVELLRRAFAEGLLPRENFEVGRDPFADGTVAMKIIGPWFVRELETIKMPGLRYDVVPVPAADGVDPAHRFAFADLRSIAIFSTTRHPDDAARFVAFLTSPEADRLLIEEASQLPYRRGLASDPRFTASLARWPTIATYAAYVEHTRDLDLDPDVVEIFDSLSEAYEASAIYGVVPVRQALTKAATEAETMLHAR